MREPKFILESLLKRDEVLDPATVSNFVNHYSKLDHLFHGAPECHYMVNFTKIRFEYMSENIKKVTGFDASELEESEHPLFNLYPRKVRELFANQVFKDILTFFLDYTPEEIKEFTFQITVPVNHKNGHQIWALLQSQYLMVSDERRPLLSFGRLTQITMPEMHKYLSYGIHRVRTDSSDLVFQKFYSLADDAEVISDREKDILKELVKGQSSKEIADHLFISANTVNNHRRNLLSKLGLQNTADLVRYALTNALY